jgi:hypothetical protein
MAPIRSGLADQKISDYEEAMDDWYHFTNETKTYYGVDMSVLAKPFSEEQKKYYLQVSSPFLWHFNFYSLLSSSVTTDKYIIPPLLSLLRKCEMWMN